MAVYELRTWRPRLPRFIFLITFLLGLSFITTGCLAAFVQDLFPTPTPAALPVNHLTTMITLAPTRGYAGTFVQVIGVGWPPGEEILLALTDENGRSPVLEQGVADQSGRLATSFLYPLNERWLRLGAHTVLAYTADEQFQSSAQFLVEIPGQNTPTPTITPFVTSTPLPTFTATATETNTPLPATPTATPPPSPRETMTSSVAVPSASTPMPTISAPATVVAFQNWRGDYWDNPALYGPPVLIRDDALLDFDWGLEGPSTLNSQIGVDNFSVRWVRELEFTPGLYRFSLEMDDGARLFIDERMVINEWQDGGPRTVSSEFYLTGGVHRLRLDFYERRGRALIRLWWAREAEFRGWRGSYFANPTLQGQPDLLRDDAKIDFDWGVGSPGPDLPTDGFSVRWEQRMAFLAGRYRFAVSADDGIRVWLDNNLVINQWSGGSPTTVEVYLTNGEYDLRVEYYEAERNAAVQFDWERVAGP